MQGLELARRFYESCAAPLIRDQLPDMADKLAFGLVGEGSECFGFDDEISRDHDWGAGFCVWCPEEFLADVRPTLESIFEQLPDTFQSYPTRMSADKRMGRLGVFGVNEFYSRFTGRDSLPEAVEDWLTIPEHYLAVCTNGEVFDDPYGAFTAHRKALLDFYPEDVRLIKMAVRCATMAQSGQYNLPRSLRRKDYVAAGMAVFRFVEAALSLLFLLNRRYVPFYKWAFRASGNLQEAPEIRAALARLASNGSLDLQAAEGGIETVCARFADHLRAQGLSAAKNDWLLEHAEDMQGRIAHERLRNMPIMAG